MEEKKKSGGRIHHKLWVFFCRERGVISIFLTGILLFTIYGAGVLMDYSRLAQAKADLRSAQQMASHTLLSSFDKKMAREFGLYALASLDVLDDGQGLLEDRLLDPLSSARPMAMGDLELNLIPTPDQRLSLPKVLEKQILQMMDWQLGRLLLGKMREHFQLLQSLSKYTDCLRAKTDYESSLADMEEDYQALSKNISRLGDSPGEEGEPAGSGKVFQGAFPMTEEVGQMDANSEKLGQALDLYLAFLSDGDGEGADQAWEELSEAFSQIESLHSKTQDRLQEESANIQKILIRIKAIEEKEAASQAKADVWGGTLQKLEASSLSQNFYSDYLIQKALRKNEDRKAFQEELEKLLRQVQDRQAAWGEIRLGGEKLQDLSFSTWSKDLASDPPRIPDARLSYPAKENFLETYALSDQSIRFQEILAQEARSDRSGLFEFIQAWNKRRKAAKAAKEANQKNLSHLSGGISDYLSASTLASYDADASGQTGSLVGSISSFSQKGILRESLGLLRSLDELLQGEIGPVAKEKVALLSYWAGMFSHKLTDTLAQKEGKTPLSLMGLPLKERPVYGAELEYILQGRDRWMENQHAVQNRIFLVRLLLNILYAFSSASLYAECSQLAFALAGWSGMGYALVQSALLCLLAVGETGLDIQRLNQGDRIPLVKSEGSWSFSLSGAGKTLSSMAKDLFDQAGEELISGIEATADLAKEGVGQMEKKAKELVSSAIKEPILRLGQEILSAKRSFNQEELAEVCSQVLGGIRDKAGPGSLGQGVNQSFQALAADPSALVGILEAKLKEKEASKGETEGILTSLERDLDGLVSGQVEKVQASIDGLSSSMTGKLSAITSNLGKESDQAIQNFFAESRASLGAGGGADHMVTAASLALNYQDYLYFFLFLDSFSESGKNALLSNTIRLANAEVGSGDFSKLPTSLSWQVQVRVKSHFLPHFTGSRFSPDSSGGILVRADWEEGYGLEK